jgi:lactate dehydrogenase-like 2-hydroxyacid dehydrogenase
VKKAYNQKWGSLGYKLGLTENARRTFYKLKIGDYYILNTDLSTVEKDAVAEILEGNYIQKCFIDTLTKSQQLFNLVVKKDLQSKTFDDMLYMKQFMHQD